MTCFSFLPFLAILRTVMDGEIEDIAVSKMGEKYGALRIVSPRADDAMVKSMRKYGQISPVIYVMTGGGYELIDGFKRLRACRHVGKETLKARVLEATERVCKAAIIQLNRGRSISELEEAMVLSSLHREDGLAQTEIAVLLGRHKSWVSRRIALIERLSEDVREDIRLGLLPASVGRDLAKLPRGNQNEAAAAHGKHRFSTREAGILIAHLLSRPRWEHHLILASPWEVVGPREPRPAGLAARLTSFTYACAAVAQAVKTISPEEVIRLSGLVIAALAAAEHAVAVLKEVRI
jgi:ParB/RepB/Spo0J family partition protein